MTLAPGVLHLPPAPGCHKANCNPPNGGTGLTDYANASSTAPAGMAVVGCIVIAIGACCPLILFRLLAFVEHGTASGAALRQSWSDAGGMSGVMSGGKQSSGSSAATQSGSDGRAGGESGAESKNQWVLSQQRGAGGAGGKTGR